MMRKICGAALVSTPFWLTVVAYGWGAIALWAAAVVVAAMVVKGIDLLCA